LIVLAAFGLRVYGLGAESLWYDEAFSVVLARADLSTALRMLFADVNPPLYYLVLRAGMAAFGSSEFAARFASLVPGVLLIPLMWVLARRLFDRSTAWLAAAFTCLSPLLVWYAREARMYGQATAFGLAATYALVRAQDEGQARWWIAFSACAVGAIYSHYSALYLVVTLGLIWLANFTFHTSPPPKREIFRSQKRGVLAFGVVATCVLIAAPLLLGLAQSSQAYWPGQLDVIPALVNTARAMVIGQQSVATSELADALIALCGALVLVAMLRMWSTPSVRRGVWLAFVILICGMALTFAVLYRRPKFEPRHLITLAPSVWLLVAAGVRAVWQMRVRAAGVLAVVTGLTLAGGLIAADAGIMAGAAPRDDWRGAVAFIRQNIRSDETIVLVSGHAFPALAYYDAPHWEALPNDLSLDVTHLLDYQSVAPALNRLQSKWHGVWLLLWQDDIVDPTQIVPALLGDIGTEVPVGASFAGLRLRHFALTHPAEFPLDPPIARRLDRSPLPGLTALGFTLFPQPLPADMPLTVRMFWRADAAHVQGAAGGSLRIVDEQNREWARRDELLGGLLYSERWPPNEWIMRQYTISLPIGTPPGTYQLRQIVYRGEENGVLDLGNVVVTRPLHPPDAAALGVAPTVLARWGNLTLLSVGLDQKALKPCESLHFTTIWQADAPLEDDYAVRMTLAGQVADQQIAPGLPTSQWQPGDVWRTRYDVAVSCRALDGPAQLQLSLVDSTGHPVAAPRSVGTVSINAGRVFTPPAMQHQFQADLAGQVRLLGYDYKYQMSPPPRGGGQAVKSQVELTLYWQATREMTTGLTVFTHVEGDRLWGQHDGPPASGLKPTDRWVIGEVVADRHVLPLDSATPPGRYRLTVGMYDPVSLVRLPAFDASGKRWPDDLIVLQEVVVTR
jgi:hypothetical protein